MTIEAIHRDIELAVGEPAIVRRMAVVERLRERRLPRQFLFGEAGPETDVVGLGLRMQRGEPLGVQAGTGDEIAAGRKDAVRSEEHTSELQSLMRISYAVFCLKKQNTSTLRQ